MSTGPDTDPNSGYNCVGISYPDRQDSGGCHCGTCSLTALTLAYAVGQRTREFGVRTALGARSRDVLVMVLGQGLRLTGIGIGVGLAAAVAFTRYVEGMLYGVTPLDPLTFVAVVALLDAVSLCASYVPARRATRVDPMAALRHD